MALFCVLDGGGRVGGSGDDDGDDHEDEVHTCKK